MNSSKSENIVWHRSEVSLRDRNQRNGHSSPLVWFTGLSGAGKSTLAHAVEKKLHDMGWQAYVLDGDNIRHGLCGDLGFSAKDRAENLRRITEVARLMTDAGIITLAAFISPFRDDRDKIRASFEKNRFLEVYCRCELAICESRDVKGVYKKARDGEISDFTGISSPYEPPLAPDMMFDTGSETLESCVERIIQKLKKLGLEDSQLKAY